MKLLVFYPYLPWPLDRGTYQRTFHLLKELAERHEVDLLALSERGESVAHREQFLQFCGRVELVSFEHPPWQKLFPSRLLNPLPASVAHWTLPQIRDGLARMIEAGRYDAVHACDIVLAQYFLDEHQNIPLVIDRSRVDLQFQLMAYNRANLSFKTKLLGLEGYIKLWRFEKRVARRAQLEIVCGPDDQAFLRKYISRSVPAAVIANGVNLEYFRADATTVSRSRNPSLLFCGALDYEPNVDALRWFFREMHGPLKQRLPNLEVTIVGKSPSSEVASFASRPNVKLMANVPDVRPFYAEAWLHMVPLRIGGGTRLKIVESLAMGTPVVSTSIGAQGLELRHGHDVLLSDTSGEFVEQTVRALNDANLLRELSENGKAVAQKRFSWRTIGHDLARLYEKTFPDHW